MSYYTKEFSLVHRAISRVSRSMKFVYTSRRGLTKGLKRRGGLGFLPGGVPTAEEEFLRTLDLQGKTVFDVGGNKYRIAAFVHYRKQIVYVKRIGTHKEYDKWDL